MVVVPAAIPVTTPDVLMVAMPVTVLLHVPPASPDGSPKRVIVPGQPVSIPVMAPALGFLFTVITAVAATVPQLLVTV